MAIELLHSILIVEDERIVAMDLQQTLQELGYDASAIASSADDALRRARERRPDLVLMDIRINGPLDGVEAAQLLKASFDVPVVYLTAHADESTLDRAKRTEPHGYLVKPVRAAELRSAVEVSLHKHQSEVRLRERERWFSTTLQSIAEAVVTVDLDGLVTFMNAAAEALIGRPAAAAVGQAVDDVLRLESSIGGDSPILAALRSGETLTVGEGRITNVASGVVRVVANSAAPVVDQQRNRRLGSVMVFRDVTSEKELQRQLERADRLASLGTMAAGLAHEVNNPLTVVLGNAEFIDEELQELRLAIRGLGERAEPAESRGTSIADALRDVRTAAGRIERIVSDIRTFARPATPAKGRIDVERCVEWALRSTAHEFRMRARIVRQLDPVPPVDGDEARLGQVLINLLMNAAHATPPGAYEQHAVTITTRREGSDDVVLEVQDTGVGIPADVMAHVFEPFFTTKPVGEGTGLGLSISHGIVRAMGGELTMASTVGQGTTVTVRLPITARPDPATARADVAPAPAARLRVLLVDDEPPLLGVFARVLRDHEVQCEVSAGTALAKIDAGQTFDVIVTDLLMPELSGVEFYRRLAARHPAQAQRLIFLSGAYTPEIEAFLQSVPNRRLTKPIDARGLIDAIVEVGSRGGPLPPAGA